MSDKKDAVRSGFWAGQLSEVDKEIARLAWICKVPLLEPGRIERVLRNDESVCGVSNKLAFDKLRSAMLIHYAVMEKSFDRLGVDETRKLVDGILVKLRERFGEQLGNNPDLPR